MSTKILNESPNLLLAQTLNDLIIKEGLLTPAGLARKLGIPTNKITRILNGDVTDPKASTLLQIANHFGININQLLGLEPLIREGEYGDLTASQMLPVFKLNHMDEQKTPREWYRWVENDLAGNYYALCIDTDLYEPTFLQHSFLIVHADLLPEDRCFVVVKKKNNLSQCSIKKYVIDGTETYFYPINPKLSIEIYDENLHTISGVILEVHQKLRTKNKL
ncbi:MAG: helix-turn-helix domain-containing protein [Tatlockia sp.]|jgi:transcriptional regulator with XRE-family HTH domain